MSRRELQGAGIASMAVKAIAWSFFIGSINYGASTLVSNIGPVTKIYFPREVFPLSAALTQTFDSLIGSTVVPVLLFLVMGMRLSVQVLWVVPLALMLIFFTAGLTMFLSSANVFFRDVRQEFVYPEYV